MADGNLININLNLEGLTDFGRAFVEKMHHFGVMLYEPTHMNRKAKAERNAALLQAATEVEVTDIQRRAARRWLEEEGRHQLNMESIAVKAVPVISESSKPHEVDDDWIGNFFTKTRIVSDNQMQDLWARILAGECNSPGAFSKRTVAILSEIDKADADLFARLCDFNWIIDGDYTPLIFDYDEDVYNSHGVDLDGLHHLSSIGLINFDPITRFGLGSFPEQYEVAYHDQRFWLEAPKLNVGHALLTRVGHQLATICSASPITGFVEYVGTEWVNHFLDEKAVRDGQQTTGRLEEHG